MSLFSFKTWSDYGFFYLVAAKDSESAVIILRKQFPNLQEAHFELLNTFESREPEPRFVGRLKMFVGIIG